MCCRHAGDLGNIEAVNGVVETTIYDHLVTLYGTPSAIGRSFVVSFVRIYTTIYDRPLINNPTCLQSGMNSRFLAEFLL